MCKSIEKIAFGAQPQEDVEERKAPDSHPPPRGEIYVRQDLLIARDLAAAAGWMAWCIKFN